MYPHRAFTRIASRQTPGDVRDTRLVSLPFYRSPTFREELGQGGLGRTRRGGVKLPYDPVRLIDIGSLVWIINTGKL